MPTIPPATINDLPRSEREEAKRLMYERALLQYRFSYEKLSEFISNDDIQSCIIARTEEEEKTFKKDLNDQITSIFTNNGIYKTLRFEDPFSITKDYIMMEGVATSFKQSAALQVVVSGVYNWNCTECDSLNWTTSLVNVHCVNARCKHFRHSTEDLKDKKKKLKLIPIAKVKVFKRFDMPAEAVQAAFDAATSKTPYVTMTVRDVKEDNGK